MSDLDKSKEEFHQSNPVISNKPTNDKHKRIIIICLGIAALTAVTLAIALPLVGLSSSEEEIAAKAREDLCKDLGKEVMSPVMVNFCLNGDCEFDVTQCTEECPFGYTRDSKQCPTACTCASSGLHSGDIDFSSPEVPQMLKDFGHTKESEVVSVFAGNAVKNAGSAFWIKGRDGMVRIPYILEPSIKRRVDKWSSAIQWYNRNTCVRFFEVQKSEERFSNTGLIKVKSGNGCSSKLGNQKSIYQERGQPLTLSYIGCNHVRTIIHELAHALGFHHEQVRPDRDDYVYVQEKNIRQNMLFNFKKLEPSDVYDMGTPYDFSSMLHYDSNSFSANGKPTMININHPTKLISGREGPTPTDKKEINMMYKCGREYRGKELVTAGTRKPATDDDEEEEEEDLPREPPLSSGKNWMQWGIWSRTYKGHQKRYRLCQSFERECKRLEIMQKRVSRKKGEDWGVWSDFGPCLPLYRKSCRGYSMRYRNRLSDSMVFQPHNAVDMKACRVPKCGSDGNHHQWSSWQEATACSAECGGGLYSVHRTCRNRNAWESNQCDQITEGKTKQEEERACNTQQCQDALQAPMMASPMREDLFGWADWGAWEPCKGGEVKRFRICNGDKKCPGHSYEIRKCDAAATQADKYKPWGAWGTCTLMMGAGKCAGTQYRFRACVKGEECDKKQTTEIKACFRCSETHKKWTAWREGECSGTCLGSMERTRECIDVKTKKLVPGCTGLRKETVPCNTNPCVAIFSPKSKVFSLTGTKTGTSKCQDDTSQWIFGDFNGDKKIEAVCTGFDGNIQLMRLVGDEETGSTIWTGELYDCLGIGVLRYAADINGDQADDLICKKQDSALYHIHLMKHNKLPKVPNYSVPLCGKDETPTFVNLNNDLRKDVLCRNKQSGETKIFINQFS